MATDQPLDPDLAARIRASVDARLAAQVQAARARIGDKRAVRDSFARSRNAGVQHRNATRAARLGLIAHHDSKETTVTNPAITEHDTPQHHNCTKCGDETPFDHYTVTTEGGTLCENCAFDLHDGLGDVAHGLSLIKSALLNEITQEQRTTVQQYCTRLAKLAGDLADGTTVVYRQQPDGTQTLERPGGDPHATIRRHTMRPVGADR